MVDSLANAIPIGLTPGGIGYGNKSGPGMGGLPGPVPGSVPGSGNVAAFKDPRLTTDQQYKGPDPFAGAGTEGGNYRIIKFIAPLALFNDAAQWINLLMFNRPMQPTGCGDSAPWMQAQYYSPPPINLQGLPAGAMNVQLQLGNIAIQTQQLSIDASNYFGG